MTMKVFAILAASVMATAGGAAGLYYYHGCNSCDRAVCEVSAVAESTSCCSQQATCCESLEPCCADGEKVSAKLTAKPDCCAAQEPCCVVGAACCLAAEKVSASLKPVEVETCCDGCVSPSQQLTTAAKAIANFK
jgi:hypothetical protein